MSDTTATSTQLAAYRPSGKFEVGGVVRALSVAIPVAAVVGGLYGVIVHYVPLIYLNALVLFVAAAVLATTVGGQIRGGNIRNAAVGALIGLVAGAAAVYAAWVIWVAALSGWQAWIFSPVDHYAIAGELLETGLRSIGSSGDPVRGVFLAALWILEALTLIAGGLIGGYMTPRRTPYIETIGQWATESAEFAPLAYFDKDEAKAMAQRLRAGEAEALAELRPSTNPDLGFTQARFAFSEVDDSEQFLTLGTVTPPKKADQKPAINVICRNLLVDRDARQVIEAMLVPQEA